MNVGVNKNGFKLDLLYLKKYLVVFFYFNKHINESFSEEKHYDGAESSDYNSCCDFNKIYKLER